MKLAIAALAAFVGPEGFFIAIGTACLCVMAGILFGPAGPWGVVGAVTLALGLALALRSN